MTSLPWLAVVQLCSANVLPLSVETIFLCSPTTTIVPLFEMACSKFCTLTLLPTETSPVFNELQDDPSVEVFKVPILAVSKNRPSLYEIP